jgi:hypothetical protein|tara:strand:+ start:6955 stop:7449 length:495 start_codon:yes stop_codon:yes gene_type:complete
MFLLTDIDALNRLSKLQKDYFLIDFEPAMIPRITPRGTDAIYFKYIPRFSEILAHYAQLGPAYMACYKGKIICMFGCLPLWNGVGEAWLITDVSLPNHARPFHRVTKIILDRFMSELNLVRLQITIHQSNVLAYKWAKVLYFKEEGVLRKFGPDGSNFYMMART